MMKLLLKLNNWTDKHHKFMKGICIFNVISYTLLTLLYLLIGHFVQAVILFCLLGLSIYGLNDEIKKQNERESEKQ